jgi:hypothetical protein
MRTKTTSINHVMDDGLTTELKQLKLFLTPAPVLKEYF